MRPFRVVLPTLLLALATRTPAATITVTSAADVAAVDGVCTLREAIAEANADFPTPPAEGECERGVGADTIVFAIPGEGPHRIVRTGQLPVISAPVHIDGCSQPGAKPNSVNALSGFDADIRIILDGGAPAMTSHPALRLAPASSGSSIRGLEITGFSSPTCCANVAISVDAETTDLVIAGNVLHNNLGGAILVAEPGPTGMPASGLRIGGPDAADRNVMYGYPGVNIVTLQACADCRLENNWFGIRTDNAPPAIVGNQTGLSLRETSNISVHDNWFGNSTRAISVSAMNDAVEIRHNLFGGAMRNLRAIDIHGTAAGFPINIDIEGNVITGQSFRGIAVSSEVAGNGVIGIRLRGNRLYGNGTLGFDLGNDGEGFAGLGSINPNDPGDGDMGPNGLQNSPVLGTPSQIGLVLEVPYALDSAPGDYLIEFSFATECSASHNALSGSMPRDPVAIETSELTGTALLQPFGIPAEGFVVAMATGSEGSSEFTACVPYSYSVSADIFRNGFEDAHGD